MLFRKIENKIDKYFNSSTDKILLLVGARQVGKSYIIRHCAKKKFKHIVEINLIEDWEGNRLFEHIHTLDNLHVALSAFTSSQLGNADDTLIFFDEIQVYPHLITLLKFLREENRYRYVASGSLLGVTLKRSNSIPIGSIDIMEMFPLDFEEFLIANDFGKEAIAKMRCNFAELKSMSENLHNRLMDLYKRYLLVGGMPEAVNAYLESRNLINVRNIQRTIIELYRLDAAKYDREHSLKISRMYNLIASSMENKKKRVIYKDIENKKGKRATDYEEEIEYLISSGVSLGVKAISNPRFPLIESEHKNLIKLYHNDPGLLTALLYHENPLPILGNQMGINIGSVYECAVACQLAANDNALFYYDNKTHGEVDFLYDDYNSLSVVPIEVKSGKDYKRHIALSRFVSTPDYNIKRGYVLSNSGKVEMTNKIVYIPIYYTIFLRNEYPDEIII